MLLNISEDIREIAQFLSRDSFLHLYSIGDLDSRFLPFTRWYGNRDGGRMTAVVCIYTGGEVPTLMALCDPCGSAAMRELLLRIIPQQPDQLQAHLSPGLEELFTDAYQTISAKAHYKMALTDPFALERIDGSAAAPLGSNDIAQLLELYEASYPGNWFEPEMLEINRYFGIREDGRLIAAAGTHVYSPEYGAAALGNITVLPDRRGLGLGTAVTAALAGKLSASGIRVGLNVKQDNAAAVSSYRKTGFAVHAEYGEYILERKRPS